MKITQRFKRLFAVAMLAACFANPILSADSAVVDRSYVNPLIVPLCAVVGTYGLYQYGMDLSQGLYGAVFGKQSLKNKKKNLEDNIRNIGIVVYRLKKALNNNNESCDSLNRLYGSIDVVFKDKIEKASAKIVNYKFLDKIDGVIKSIEHKQKRYWFGSYSLCTSFQFFMNTRFRSFDSDETVVFDWLKSEDATLLSDYLDVNNKNRLARINDFCIRAKKRLDFYVSYLNGINRALLVRKVVRLGQ